MLSVLIPVYNFDVRQLVTDLHHQLSKCTGRFEILCYDDCSDKSYSKRNQSLNELDHVVYQVNTQNMGRSKTRNLLAEKAQYKYLLFMDGDSKIKNPDFIKKYLARTQYKAVICGGTAYEEEAPKNTRHYLRWYYGINREVSDSKTRQKHPYRSFSTHHFMIPRKTYLSVKLDENLKGYGHEDTLFGKMLKEKKVPILHINNPLIHIGLDDNEHFLKKTKEGVYNLARLIKTKKADSGIKLYRYYLFCKKTGLSPLLRFFHTIFHKAIEKNLKSSKPSLRLFDLYKLTYLLRIA